MARQGSKPAKRLPAPRPVAAAVLPALAHASHQHLHAPPSRAHQHGRGGAVGDDLQHVHQALARQAAHAVAQLALLLKAHLAARARRERLAVRLHLRWLWQGAAVRAVWMLANSIRRPALRPAQALQRPQGAGSHSTWAQSTTAARGTTQRLTTARTAPTHLASQLLQLRRHLLQLVGQALGLGLQLLRHTCAQRC